MVLPVGLWVLCDFLLKEFEGAGVISLARTGLLSVSGVSMLFPIKLLIQIKTYLTKEKIKIRTVRGGGRMCHFLKPLKLTQTNAGTQPKNELQL